MLLDRIFASPPSPPQVARLKPMRDRVLAARANGDLAWEDGFKSNVVSQQFDPTSELHEFRLVTLVDLTKADRVTEEKNTSFGGWEWAATAAEIDWRKRHDRKAYQAEYAREEEARELEEQAAVGRRNTRLKELTLMQLRSEPVLPQWNGTYPPPEFADAVRARILETIDALQDLGERPGRPAGRKTLTKFVEWLNERDEASNHPIETIEREQLCDVIEELCWAARQPALVEDIQGLRDW